MEIILLEKVENLGSLGDRVNVKSGYGRNFLIPSGKATPATEAHIKAFEERRTELEKTAAGTLTAAQARAEQLADFSITITAKAGDEGKLFGSVGTNDIAAAVTAAGVAIERHEVRLPEGAFRQVGEYQVGVHLHTDINLEIVLVVEAE